MKYLVVQEWESTKNNHAGMKHMCDLLYKKYPFEYKVIVCHEPQIVKTSISGVAGKFILYIKSIFFKRQYTNYLINISKDMFSNLHDGDEIFLLEYHCEITPQYWYAKYIRRKYKNIRIYALSHYTPSMFKLRGVDKYMNKWAKVIDKQLTLGSSLTIFFEKHHFDRRLLSTGFHYVDTAYYSKRHVLVKGGKPTIIAIGSMQRNYSMLSEIVKACPDFNWIICRGNKLVENMFPQADNIKLLGYLKEDELREQMDKSDISLNVMDDTVGSNVITTSMAMGLAIIVSNVGSIHDYCDESNAFFCENTVYSFVKAIKSLTANDDIIYKMRISSIRKAKDFEIDNIHNWFCSLKQ